MPRTQQGMKKLLLELDALEAIFKASFKGKKIKHFYFLDSSLGIDLNILYNLCKKTKNIFPIAFYQIYYLHGILLDISEKDNHKHFWVTDVTWSKREILSQNYFPCIDFFPLSVCGNAPI